MSAPTSINKKVITKHVIIYSVILLASVLIIYTLFLKIADKNINNYLRNQKKTELQSITDSVTNEILNSDFRTLRNKLILLKNSNTFDSYVLLNNNFSAIESSDSSNPIEQTELQIAVQFPGTGITHSYIKYIYSNINYEETKKIFLIYILTFFFVLIVTFGLSLYKLISFLNKILEEYELSFNKIIDDPYINIPLSQNPLLPSILNLKNNLIELDKKSKIINELETHKFKFSLSQKLAHDIRSPISTLNLISSKIENEDIKSLQLAVVDQINAIANDLLNESKEKNTTNTSEVHNAYGFEKMLQNLEKEYQFKANAIKQTIRFKINYNEVSKYSLDPKLTSIIYRSINNFIQNSIDATNENGVIDISADTISKGRLEISVKDNGKGIPKHILNRIGQEILSHGKPNRPDAHQSGNGIALYNAKKELSEFNAELEIESELNTGTKIRIII